MTKSRSIAVFLSSLIVLMAVLLALRFMGIHSPQFGTLQGHTKPATAGPSALVRSLRPNFPYSVIAGGAYSPGELRFADSNDAVVRAHYADFDISHAKMVTLTDDRFEYLSYRLQNQVYWTKRKLRIPKGELLLSDGSNYARARCGNRLSDQPHQAAASLHEPDPALLSLPPMSIGLLPRLTLAEPPELAGIPATQLPAASRTGAATPVPAYSQPFVPLEPMWGGQPVTGGGLIAGPLAATPLVPTGGTPGNPATPTTPVPPVNPPPPPPATPIPEPATIYLFLVSLVVSIWVLLRVSRSDKSEQ